MKARSHGARTGKIATLSDIASPLRAISTTGVEPRRASNDITERGVGSDSAQQIIAEVGAAAAIFPSAKRLASWVGACPSEEKSAGVSYSHRSPKGNRQMRRLLNQAAHAAVKTKGSIFQLVYRRLVPRLGHAQAIGAIAHRLCRLICKILHQGVRY